MVQLLSQLATVIIMLLVNSAISENILDTDGQVMDTDLETDVEIAKPPNACPIGCLTCSKWNGCLECATNFTWHIEKVNMRKIGVCLRICPPGYFIREFHHAPGHYRCIECKAANCAVCGNRDFCDKCQQPYLEYRGTCILRCPGNLYHSRYRKDCYEQVDCLLQSWTEWSACLRDGKSCGYKWGNQTRKREILQSPSPNGNACSLRLQSQKCKLVERYCNFNNSARLFVPISHERHERRREKRRRRCRLQSRAGKPCKREDNYVRESRLKPTQTIEQIRANNASSDYDYYRQSAEILRLLKLKKSSRQYRKDSSAGRAADPDPG